MEFSCLESKEVYDLPESSEPETTTTTTKTSDGELGELEESTSEEPTSALSTAESAEEEQQIASEVIHDNSTIWTLTRTVILRT